MLFDPIRGRMSVVDNGFLLIYYPAGIKINSLFFIFLITHFAYAKRSFRNDKGFLWSITVANFCYKHGVYCATGSKVCFAPSDNGTVM